jgi:hypothetical protein
MITTKFLNKLPLGVNHLRGALLSEGHGSNNTARFNYLFGVTAQKSVDKMELNFY